MKPVACICQAILIFTGFYVMRFGCEKYSMQDAGTVGFVEEVRKLSGNFAKRLDHLETEEATKHALVLPFIQMLGYATYDPTEVVPEFTADVGTKKDEKVDYALMRDGKPAILVECKTYGTNLNEKLQAQLHRYFLTTDTRFGILTDGIIYKFFSDLDEDNKMDREPFFEFDMLDFDDSQVAWLERFKKANFGLEALVNAARELKYTARIKRAIAEELESPSEEFVRFIVGRVYEGRATSAIREQFRAYMLRAFAQTVQEQASPSSDVSTRASSQTPDTSPQVEPEVSSAEPPVPQLSGWQSLATLKPAAVNGVSPKPLEIRFPDNSHRPIKRWSHVVVEVTGWLMRNNLLHEESLPIRRHSRYLVAKDPTHPSGKPFKNPQLVEHVFTEGNYSAHDHMVNARIVIEHVGQAPANFAVRFD